MHLAVQLSLCNMRVGDVAPLASHLSVRVEARAVT